MRKRTILLAALGSLAIAAIAAQAQVPGVNSALNTVFTLAYDNSTMKPTYSATGTQTVAASATDVCTLTGSATKNVRVRRVIVSGLALAVISEPVSVVKRSTATAGATSAALTMVPYDSSNAAATAFAERWTGNGTVGTLVGVLADVYYTTGNYTTGVGAPAQEFTFGELGQPVVLRGAAQTLAVNLSGITWASGALTCTFEWTEE
jgi:hypothetical protein